MAELNELNNILNTLGVEGTEENKQALVGKTELVNSEEVFKNITFGNITHHNNILTYPEAKFLSDNKDNPRLLESYGLIDSSLEASMQSTQDMDSNMSDAIGKMDAYLERLPTLKMLESLPSEDRRNLNDFEKKLNMKIGNNGSSINIKLKPLENFISSNINTGDKDLENNNDFYFGDILNDNGLSTKWQILGYPSTSDVKMKEIENNPDLLDVSNVTNELDKIRDEFTILASNPQFDYSEEDENSWMGRPHGYHVKNKDSGEVFMITSSDIKPFLTNLGIGMNPISESTESMETEDAILDGVKEVEQFENHMRGVQEDIYNILKDEYTAPGGIER